LSPVKTNGKSRSSRQKIRKRFLSILKIRRDNHV
jgi:hypothetical protein